MSDKTTIAFAKRTRRVRLKLRSRAVGRPRLSVFRSSKHIYAQVIDDSKGATLVAASSRDEEVANGIKIGVQPVVQVKCAAIWPPVAGG